jgi:spermidine synthase
VNHIDQRTELNWVTRGRARGITASPALLFWICTLFMVLSGFASLVYQVTWVRLLGLSLGSTSASISIVVSSFFLGMSLGSFFADRLTRNGVNGFGVYLTIELLIGLSGLVSLPVLLQLDYLLYQVPEFGTQPLLKLALTLILLILPTTCMGATFPVIASLLIRNDKDVGLRISHLYSLNTLGAVSGAALSGFVLIPHLGLDGSIYAAAAVNFLIAGAALVAGWYLKPILSLGAPETASVTDPSPSSDSHWPFAASLTLAVTGFASIATQVGWTKYLSVFVGSTIYGLSVILTVFLTGIALGSWFIRRHLDNVRSAQAIMALGLLAAALTLIFARAGLTYVPGLQQSLNQTDATGSTVNIVRYVAVFAILLPPAIIFGALFPLNLKIFCHDSQGVRSRIGKAYAINTLASILGAAVAGFIAIPFYGTDWLLLAMAVLVAATSLAWVPLIGSRRMRLATVAFGAAVIVTLFATPRIDYGKLIATVGYDSNSRSGKPAQYLFLKEGKAGIISLITFDGKKVKLQNNGLNEAQLTLSDPNDVPVIEALLGFIPYAFHKNPKSAFVVGFGGGTTTRTLADTGLPEVRVVELEPAIVEAGRFIPGGPIEALDKPNVHLDFNDARNVLIVENKKYDLIISQPSHPWIAGAAGVFSQDFWEITRSRLNAGGVFAQWVNLFRMDATTLKSILKAFFSAYPHGMVFNNPDNLILIGSDQPLEFDYKRFNDILSIPAIKEKFRGDNVRTVHDVIWFYALSREDALAASADAIPNTDTNVLSEIRLSALVDSPTGGEDPRAFIQRNSNMNVSGYLGSDAKSKMILLALYFLREKAYQKAEKAIAELATLAPDTARILDHRRLVEMLNYTMATRLYNSHATWTNEAGVAQAGALIEIGDYDAARAILAQAEQTPEAEREIDRLAYLEKRPRLKTRPEAERLNEWSLMAAADTGDVSAEDALVSLIKDEGGVPRDARISLYKAVMRRFAVARNSDMLQVISLRLAKETALATKRLIKIAGNALDEEDKQTAVLAIARIEELDKSADGLDALRKRMARKDGGS